MYGTLADVSDVTDIHHQGGHINCHAQTPALMMECFIAYEMSTNDQHDIDLPYILFMNFIH